MKTKKLLAIMIAAVMVFALLPASLFAAAWPSFADGDTINLAAGETYPALTIPSTIVNGVTIEGNGATVGTITINTSAPVVIKNVKTVTIMLNGILTGSVYEYNVTIEGCTFGSASQADPPFRSIYFREATLVQPGSFVVKNCTFYEATYNINLLAAKVITIEGNTFNSGNRPALQYTVTAENKDNITIRNNTFNGTANAFLVTIADGSSGADAGIGNVANNTFNGSRAVVSVSDSDVERLIIPFNTGLSVSNLWFSSYSLNTNFKPTVTGPLTGSSMERVIFVDGTEVTAKADVTYTVIIPPSVNFGTIYKTMPEQSIAFPITVRDALLEDGYQIKVEKTAGTTEMKDKNGTGSKTLPFAFTPPTEGFVFTADGTKTGSVTCNPKTDLQVAGSYKGYMTFSVSYVPAA